jgi:hypothetical protein
MRRMVLLLSVLGGAAALWPAAGVACGDKFLVIGRNTKRIPKAHHPAVVLLYLRPGSSLPAAAKEMKLGATLLQASHTVETATDEGALRESLAAHHHDFVLVDPADAAVLERLNGTAASRPQVVPVVDKASDETLRALQAHHPLVIQTGRSLSYLAALDEAMGRKSSALALR